VDTGGVDTCGGVCDAGGRNGARCSGVIVLCDPSHKGGRFVILHVQNATFFG
jgi:hypothetical protein